jgi:hypothetical protein
MLTCAECARGPVKASAYGQHVEGGEMSRSLVVQCSSDLEADAAAKVVAAMRRAVIGGMLTANWEIKLQRHQGGRVKVFFSGEVDAADAFKDFARATPGGS